MLSWSQTPSRPAPASKSQGRAFSLALMFLALGAGACKGAQEQDPNAEAQAEPPAPSPEPESEAPTDPADVVLKWRERLENDPALPASEDFPTMRSQLRGIANEADDVHLRANAALLLGAAHEARKEYEEAIGLYRHATKLVADDAGPHMALALALASAERFEEAARVQLKATELDPDNLENWLVQAELWMKANEPDEAKAAYVGYERRRKGLIDGLTLQKDGQYVLGSQERAGCARALASSADQGTANALIYALKTESDPKVRATVVEVMGTHRLGAYRPALEAALAAEKDAGAREALAWALAEIARDPVEIKATPAPPEAGEADGEVEPSEASRAQDEADPAAPGDP